MKSRQSIFLIGATLAIFSGAAAAGNHVSFGISVGVPGVAYVTPAPVYYYPPPQAVYYTPPVVYYAPPAVYYAPRPVIVVGGHYRGWHNGYRHYR